MFRDEQNESVWEQLIEVVSILDYVTGDNNENFTNSGIILF